jgi:hypothetical protein
MDRCFDEEKKLRVENLVTLSRAMTATGNIIPARRDNKSHYHMDGDLVIR